MYKSHPKYPLEVLENALLHHKNFNAAGKSLGIPGKVFQRQLAKARGKVKVSTKNYKSCKACYSIFYREKGLQDKEWSRKSTCSPCKKQKRAKGVKENYLRTRKATLKARKNDPKVKEYRKKYWKSDKGKSLARHYHSRRRALLKSCPTEPGVAEYIITLFSNPLKCCRYCQSTEDLTLEHVVPLSRGGSHTRDNLDVACKTCNITKKNKTEQEYIEYLKQIKD